MNKPVALGIIASIFILGAYIGISQTLPKKNSQPKTLQEAVKEPYPIKEGALIDDSDIKFVEKDKTPTSPEKPVSSLSLNGNITDAGVVLSWEAVNLPTSGTYKLVKNLTGNPTYPEDPSVSIEDPSVRSYNWDIKDGKTWTFRACYFANATCLLYSNEIQLQTKDPNAPSADTPTEDQSSVKSISLSGSALSSSKVKLNWSISGTSEKGFKVVWSKDSGPEYPNREGDFNHYLESSSAREDTVESLSAGKKYYFRVCEYTGSKCGKYSNEISVTTKSDSSADASLEKINLSLSKVNSTEVKLKWSVEGDTENGFKILWSKNSEPTYPLGDGDKYHYKTDPSTRSDSIGDLSDHDKYYFRVCEYKDGKCLLYSNQVTFND